MAELSLSHWGPCTQAQEKHPSCLTLAFTMKLALCMRAWISFHVKATERSYSMTVCVCTLRRAPCGSKPAVYYRPWRSLTSAFLHAVACFPSWALALLSHPASGGARGRRERRGQGAGCRRAPGDGEGRPAALG